MFPGSRVAVDADLPALPMFARQQRRLRGSWGASSADAEAAALDYDVLSSRASSCTSGGIAGIRAVSSEPAIAQAPAGAAATVAAATPAAGASDEESRQRLAATLLRMKQIRASTDAAKHLKFGPLDMISPPVLASHYRVTSNRPVTMSYNPKWSTDLKRLERQANARMVYDRRLTASTTGSMLPEKAFLRKTF
eukprot:TRINITY_DN72548_c0_g1_i1.p2 TRINITY_DN72548_c0_g1~~TRINITY_DN72548_c0_g1_i1.p2  ORF type:complete len:194 (+),score=35.62 TRINITY_DN72548_c0_g1_i1:199-780(+)